jgi:hypothetical protein
MHELINALGSLVIAFVGIWGVLNSRRLSTMDGPPPFISEGVRRVFYSAVGLVLAAVGVIGVVKSLFLGNN